MTLEHRITRLEGSLRDQDTIRETDISTDSLIGKLGLDPEMVRATAKENNKGTGEVVAGELSMSYRNLQRALRLIARGECPTLP